jgi:poly(A) polymerase
MSSATIAGADWLSEPSLQKLLTVLSQDGEQARIAGGAVRNALLGEPVADVDIATTNLPDETIRRAKAAGFRAVPTGIDHGTITVIADGKPYEVTTLRADIDTDGRHATVQFGRDWKADAERRDFTINGLYAEPDGTVIDLVGGVADLNSRTLRFIGDPEKRITEDYLRILRFFRFFAWYGSGRPDAEGLKACARLKSGLAQLSAERVWAELKKLFAAPDPSRALLWMRQASVLTTALPESEKWGIDTIHPLVATEREHGWQPDAMLRLESIVPPDAARLAAMSERLRMSNDEAARLDDFARAAPANAALSDRELAKVLYRGKPGGIEDRLRLAIAGGKDAKKLLKQLAFAGTWQRPRFPVSGEDLKALGMTAGPAMGARLKHLEDQWIASNFSLSREQLLGQAGAGAR